MKEITEKTHLLNDLKEESLPFELLKLPKGLIKHTFTFFKPQELSRMARVSKSCKNFAYDCQILVQDLQINEERKIKYGEFIENNKKQQNLATSKNTKESFNDLMNKGGYVSPMYCSAALGGVGLLFGTVLGACGGSTIALALGYGGGGCCCITSICLCKKVHKNTKDIENIDSSMPPKLEMN